MVEVKDKIKSRSRSKIKSTTRKKPKLAETSKEDTVEDDFVLIGKAAEDFYQNLMFPPKNKQRDQFTQEALKLFPDPTKPTTITLPIFKDE